MFYRDCTDAKTRLTFRFRICYNGSFSITWLLLFGIEEQKQLKVASKVITGLKERNYAVLLTQTSHLKVTESVKHLFCKTVHFFSSSFFLQLI